MHLDLSWIFSIFKVPKISRPLSGISNSDARNFRLRGNSNYFRLGHLVWRAPCFYDRNVKSRCDATFSIPEELASTSASIVKAGLNKIWGKTKAFEPGSQAPFVSFQKLEDNEKPPPKASQHGRIPGGQYPFYSSSLSYLPFDFLPNTNSESPSRSLLFLPPPPPFPPAPEPNPESNQFGTTNPVRTPDHEFSTTQSTNTTLSLSPLPIALSPLDFPPLAAPPPPELVIKIPGPGGYLNADHHKSQITHFLSRATEVANSLVVIWQISHIDSGGRRGLTSLKALFAQLDEKLLDSDRTALSRFSKLSITIPDQVKPEDVAPYTIDLANAMDLHEFDWHGNFVIFASNLKNLQFVTLTRLNIKSSDISINDAITLLHSCPGLQSLSLGTIRSEEDTDAIIGMSLESSGGIERRKALPRNLTYLALESDVALHPLIRRFCWTAQVSLSLTLRKQGTASLVQALNSASQ